MIRIIVKTYDLFPDGTSGPAEFRTFDVQAELLELFLAETGEFRVRAVVGAELIEASQGGPL